MHNDIRQQLRTLHICVIVPTYNNQGTITQVLQRLIPYTQDIIVVNDGSTDQTARLLKEFRQTHPSAQTGTQLTVISYPDNCGKGHALRMGFRQARSMGFDYAITIDSDGQHFPEDIPLLTATLQQAVEKGCTRTIVVGNRKLQQANMPKKNTFANYFSNFWFMFQTWQYLPDTQTGFRIYPLRHLHGLSLLTARYEAELELLVFAAWHGVQLLSTPIRVYYPPREERVSHFRPFWDFFRISVLNTILCLICFCYGWWAILFNFIVKRFK